MPAAFGLMRSSRDRPDAGFFFSYSDIVFAPLVATSLARAAGAAEVSLIVDRRWEDAYVGRTEHPLPEAELARVVESAAGPAGRQSSGRARPRPARGPRPGVR